MGKTVIAIDLNPLSRTARAATITIVDNVVRALPRLAEAARSLKGAGREQLESIVRSYDNDAVLREVVAYIARRLEELAKTRLALGAG